MKNKKKDKTRKYVLYGFCKSDIEEVGYLARIPTNDDDEVISDDLSNAMLFDDKNVDSAIRYVNEEFDDIYGPYAYKFHKVKISI